MRPYLPSLVLFLLLGGCGGNKHSDQRRLNQENDQLRSQLDETRRAKAAAEAEASAATQALTAKLSLAEAQGSLAVLEAQAEAMAKTNTEQTIKLTAAKSEARILQDQLNQVRANLKKAGVSDGKINSNADLAAHFADILKDLATTDGTDTGPLRRDLKASLQLPDAATDDDIKKALSQLAAAKAQADQATIDLQKALLTSKAELEATKLQLIAVQDQLAQAKAQRETAAQAGAKTLADNLGLFSGMWLAENKALPNVDKDCRVFLRVTASPSEISRIISCSGERVELQVLAVEQLGLGLGNYDGGLAVTPTISKTQSSCSSSQTSRTPDLSGLYFNTATHSGAAAATSVHSTIGGLSLDFILGAADDLKGTTCDNISSELPRAVSDAESAAKAAAAVDANAALKAQARDAAARVDILTLMAGACKATATSAGCFTAAGFQPRSGN